LRTSSPPKRPESGSTPQLPPKQTCGKCDAEFRWEPSDPRVKGSPLVARLSKPSDNCDCGYGSLPPRLE
jgi:hypothetical protein